MEYRLHLNKVKPKIGQKYKIISITDIALHTTDKHPTPIGKKLRKAFKTMKPGRIYGKVEASPSADDNKQAVIAMIHNDPDFVKMVMEYERQGYKVALDLPDKIPLVLGQDSVQFLASVNGQRIMRGLAKDNPER
jgi:hypothetical protein